MAKPTTFSDPQDDLLPAELAYIKKRLRLGSPGSCLIMSVEVVQLINELERRRADVALGALSVLEVQALRSEHDVRPDPHAYVIGDDFSGVYSKLWQAHADLLARLERHARDTLEDACAKG